MGIGNNADYIARIQRHQETRDQTKLEEAKRDELLARHELSGIAYLRAGKKKQMEIRSRVMCLSLKRFF